MRARGADASHYQLAHLMRWLAWKALGFCFAWARLSIGLSRDAQAQGHVALLRAAGYLFGGYHALHEAVPARAQARFFLALIEELMPDCTLPAMLDVEREKLSEQNVVDFLHEWSRITLREIGIYTSANSWHKIVGRRMRLWARQLKLWVAGYPNDRSDYDAAGNWQGQLMDPVSVARRSASPAPHLQPLLPDPWGLAVGSTPPAGWTWWQTTGHGRLPEYPKDLDLNDFNGTEAELRQRYAPPPVQVEDSMRLCAHIIGSSRDAMRLTLEAKAPVVKLVDDWGAAAEYAAMPHQPLVVGRVTVDPELRPDYLADHGFDPSVIAEIYFDAHLRRHVLANPAVQAWCGPCEPVCKTPEAMEWYGAFEAARVELLAELGKRAVVGSFSTGQPEPELWPQFREALDAIRRRNGYLSLHEYSEPSRGWDTWYVGRFTRAPRDVKKIIGEHGTDSLPPVPEDGSQPQRHPAGQPWRGQFRGAPDSVAAYGDWLQAMDQRYRQHADIVGVCIFTFGQLWPHHNVEGTGLAERLIAYAQGHPEPPPLPVPTEPPAPVIVKEGDPMQQYVIVVSDQITGGRLRELLGVDLVDMRVAIPVESTPTTRHWWELWPEGKYELPGRALAIPNKLITFYRVDGVALNPQPINRPVTWQMWAVERAGGLLNVFDQAGTANDWWVRAEDVAPA